MLMGPKFILDHADYGPQLNVLVWLLLSLSGLFLFTRLYLKHSQKRGLWWDDWILLASWLALAAEAGLTAYLVSLGYGRQLIPLKNLARFGLPSNVLSTLLIISNLWGKTSFGMTLLRIPVRRMRVCVWFILTSLTAIFTLSVVLVWVDCLPFRTPKACVPIDVSTRYNVFSCVYSALVDVALAFLPWKYLLGLQMSKKEKIGVVVAMSMGLLAGATAAVKATTIPKVNVPDARGSIPLVALGTAEAAVCIMAASIPILRALARGSFRRGAPQGYYGTGYPTTTMADNATGRTVSVVLPVPQPTRTQQTRQGLGGRTGSSADVLGDELTAGNAAAVGPPPGANEDVSDDERIEMSRYQMRPQSPVDFTRSAGHAA